jgi:hypothetical protein
VHQDELKIITEARDEALERAKKYVGGTLEFEFLTIAQKLDKILRPDLIGELEQR